MITQKDINLIVGILKSCNYQKEKSSLNLEQKKAVEKTLKILADNFYFNFQKTNKKLNLKGFEEF